jgi:tetratricopeptide (TPR) repeat protein
MAAARTFARYAVVVLFLAAGYAFAQSGGQSGGSSGGGNSGGGNTPNVPAPSATRPTTQSVPQAEQRRPMYISGRVMLDDGTEPTERVAIERICNGRARREGYTDSHGQFSFQLGASLQEVFQDASVSGRGFDMGNASGGSMSPEPSSLTGPNSGVSPRDLLGCELQASLPGYRSDSIPLTGRQAFDNPDVGVIVLHHYGKVEGTRISMIALKAPKKAKKAYQRGVELLKKKKIAEAEEEFSKAVKLYPNYADALSRLGDIEMDRGHREQAGDRYRQALAADPKFIPPYFGLTLIAAQKQDWNAMADLSAQALALDAYEYPGAYFYNGVANYNLHKMDQAEKSARMARRLDSQYHIPKIDFLMANILLQRSDYAGAAQQLRSFLKYSPSGPDADAARRLLSTTESKLASAPAAK